MIRMTLRKFVETRCQRILDLFASVSWYAVRTADEDPDSETVYRTYDHLKFLSRAVADHFRSRVGLNAGCDPLRDAELLGACRLINRFQFQLAGFPTTGVLAMGKKSAVEIVHLATENIEELMRELERLRDHLRNRTKQAEFWFPVQIEADQYLRSLAAHPNKAVRAAQTM